MANKTKPSAGKKTAAVSTKPATKIAARTATSPIARLTGKAKILSSKVTFKGKVFSVTTDTVTEPGGVTSTRDVIRHNGSVVILAVDTSVNAANPTILVERQYRHAAGQFLYELPAGRIEPNEPPLAAAKRELIEETGFRARRWSRLVRYYASPGFLAETMQVFLAEDIRPGEAQPEEDEKISLHHIPLSELLELIRQGEILDGKTILSVLLFSSNRK